MPEIPLKITRAIICKKARELRHNNFMGQGESVLCNFAERAPMPRGIENPEKKELRCYGQGSGNREGSSRTSLDSTAIDALLSLFSFIFF